MEGIGIWSGSSVLADQLEGRLGGSYRFLRGGHGADFAQQPLALLVVSPDATGLAGLGVLTPRLALLPGGNVAACRLVRAASAVSYGLGSQNTLTLSSMTGTSVSVALQRELVTVSGRTVEPQEWVLSTGPDTTADQFLCLAGALLLLDQGLG